MAWSTLPAYSDGTALTAAMLTAIKDNINETAAAKATTAGRYFASTGGNTIAERVVRQTYDAAGGTTSSSSFTNLAGASPGPACDNTVTGPLALVCVECQCNNSTGGASSRMSYEVLNATSSAATDDRGILDQNSAGYDNRYASLELQALTPGTNDFRSRYRVSSGNGSFSARTMIVMAF